MLINVQLRKKCTVKKVQASFNFFRKNMREREFTIWNHTPSNYTFSILTRELLSQLLTVVTQSYKLILFKFLMINLPSGSLLVEGLRGGFFTLWVL